MNILQNDIVIYRGNTKDRYYLGIIGTVSDKTVTISQYYGGNWSRSSRMYKDKIVHNLGNHTLFSIPDYDKILENIRNAERKAWQARNDASNQLYYTILSLRKP